MNTPDDDMTDTDTDVTELFEVPPPPAEVFKQVSDLMGLIANGSACETRLASLRRAHAKIRSAAKRSAAEKEAFAAYKAAAEAEIEPQRKSAANVWAHAKAKEAAVEAREAAVELAERRCRELGVDPSPPAVYRSPDVHHDFIPIAGTTITRAPERLPTPDEPIEDASEPPHTVRRGHGDSVDFPPGTTLSRQSEEPPPSVRVRVRNRRGGAAHAE
jgi:hypothetical protein